MTPINIVHFLFSYHSENAADHSTHLSSVSQLLRMMLYPVHGLAHPVRLRYPVGNAFAQQAELRRWSEVTAQQDESRRRSALTAYQHSMATQRQHVRQVAHHHHASYGPQAMSPVAHRDHHVNANPPRAFGHPVSSWNSVNNSNHNNTFQGTLEHSQQSEFPFTIDATAAVIPLQEVLLPADDPNLAGFPEEAPPEPDYSLLLRFIAQIQLGEPEMSKCDREAAFPGASPYTELMKASRRERTQHTLHDLATKCNMDLRTVANQQALHRPGNLFSESNKSGRSERDRQTLRRPGNLSSGVNMSGRIDRNPTDSVSHGFPSVKSNVSHRNGLNQQALPRFDDSASQPNTCRRTNRNYSTPLRFDGNSPEFTPRSIEHNKPTFLPPAAKPSESTPRRVHGIKYDLLRPMAPSSDQRNHEFNYGISGSARAGSELHPIVAKRIGPPLPVLLRPDSEVSEVLMPRRTPPARFAALTTQQTAPLPSHLFTASQYVKKAAKNDAIILSSGPTIPTNDGNCEFSFLYFLTHRYIDSFSPQTQPPECPGPTRAAKLAA